MKFVLRFMVAHLILLQALFPKSSYAITECHDSLSETAQPVLTETFDSLELPINDETRSLMPTLRKVMVQATTLTALLLSPAIHAQDEMVALGGNTRIRNFDMAKTRLERLLPPNATEFYCGCPIEGNRINIEACGYMPRLRPERARVLEWEHIVPAYAFGRTFPEWFQGHPDCQHAGGMTTGRRCVAQVSQEFRFMEGDLYNLQPALGEVNGDRLNYRMGMIDGEERVYGRCDVEIKNQIIEPRPEVRGDVARTTRYMDAMYKERGIINFENDLLFREWEDADPVDAAECHRAFQIEQIQGNANGFVKFPCLQAGLYK